MALRVPLRYQMHRYSQDRSWSSCCNAGVRSSHCMAIASISKRISSELFSSSCCSCNTILTQPPRAVQRKDPSPPLLCTPYRWGPEQEEWTAPCSLQLSAV